MIFLGAMSFLVLFILLVVKGLNHLKTSANTLEIIIGTSYALSIVLFIVGLSLHDNPYHRAIIPEDMECYSPFSDRHALTLIFFFLAFNTSLALVWAKNIHLPPLTMTLSLIFIVIGIIISIAILFQVSVHNTETLKHAYDGNEGKNSFLLAPLFSILIGTWLLFQAMTFEIREITERTYSNKSLHILQTFLATRSRNPLWIGLFLFPVFFIVTLILILFGQDTNSIVKVFTDTTTWKFSQQMHPPPLDHMGHYLCTVAASGHPKVVKPLRIGHRNGRPIIVNRQLLIANAFEEMVQDISPKLHRFIRKNYDKYGYNISKKINTPYLSNITYLLMKPLEWFFLICLYSFCNKPEQKINKQYTPT